MSTAVALPKSQTRAEVFVGEVLPPDRLESVLSQLPAHVKPERFQRNLVVAITQHPRLLDCDPVAVFNEVSKAAALGLYFDPQLGEAYLITGFSNGRYVPQLRLGYRGLIKLTRQSGAVATVYAHDVCANDKFKMSLGTNKFLEHEPDFLKDRGEIGLYYAVVKFADGETDFEPISLKDIHRIRDRSDGWRAFKAGKIKSTPWGTDEGEMAKKTVLRRLLKRLPQSPEIADALRIDDEDFREVDDNQPMRAPLSARLVASSGAPGFSIDHVEIETNSNSSQAVSPSALSETDTPASVSPADAGTNSGEAAEAAEDHAAGLPAGWQGIYAQAMTRVSDKPKSLATRRTEALRIIGGEPSDADRAEMEAMEDLVKRRNSGAISPDAFKASLREIMPTGVEI